MESAELLRESIIERLNHGSKSWEEFLAEATLNECADPAPAPYLLDLWTDKGRPAGIAKHWEDYEDWDEDDVEITDQMSFRAMRSSENLPTLAKLLLDIHKLAENGECLFEKADLVAISKGKKDEVLIRTVIAEPPPDDLVRLCPISHGRVKYDLPELEIKVGLN